MANRETLILTCAGGAMMPRLAALLRQSKPTRRLVGADANPALSAAQIRGFDAFFPVPLATDGAYVVRLLEKVQPLAPAVLVPGSDEEALALAPHTAALRERGIFANVMAADVQDRFRDKASLGAVLRARGLPSPDFIAVSSPAEAAKAARQLGYPDRIVVVKPRIGRGRRGVHFLSATPVPHQNDVPDTIDLDALERVWPEIGDHAMVMEFVRGDAWTADVLARYGKVEQMVSREWLATWRFPFPGQRVCRNADLAQLVAGMAECLELHGLIDIDIIRDAGGRFQIIEVNPRPSGSIIVSIAAGIPLYDQLGALLQDSAVESRVAPDGLLIGEKDLPPA